ncbi:hypothetical protein BWQ96_04710 [Gracilariopsis chorda]|uniref:Alpha-glucan water dikinase-like N-terminal Ig-like domain-containing protein n=1 Tax=Gracilariopsis chorda TaxID=448386 RepID=A0A2V3ITQ1_9FLOR|nr:hypothetical protein BWQ96_04710 [Gracilariopsis chorda]|eukprot:PXF45508.1 hypothetical protein BWQ96_04710 [Gracilariopsis chorda]
METGQRQSGRQPIPVEGRAKQRHGARYELRIRARRSSEVDSEKRSIQVHVVSTIAIEGSDIVLHWGVKRGGKGEWCAAPSESLPEGTNVMPDGKAAQTVLQPRGESACARSRASTSTAVHWEPFDQR